MQELKVPEKVLRVLPGWGGVWRQLQMLRMPELPRLRGVEDCSEHHDRGCHHDAGRPAAVERDGKATQGARSSDSVVVVIVVVQSWGAGGWR